MAKRDVDLGWEREATRVGRAPTRPETENGAEPAQRVSANVVSRPRRATTPPPAGSSGGADDAAAALAQARAFAQRRPTLSLQQHILETPLADERLVMLREPESERSAAYRVLRHRLVSQHAPQVLVVSSPVQEERKTTCAINLALALGEHHRARVLLLEANFTAPALANAFGFRPTACFTEQIAVHQHNTQETWHVDELLPCGLHVLAVDPDNPRPSRLDARAFAAAVRQFRVAGYDHLVIDAPRVLRSAEVNVIQEPADGVLLNTRKGRSTSKQVRAAIEQLLPNSVLGVVLHED